VSIDDAVLLDLNVPTFQKKLFELDSAEVKKVFKTFQKLQALTWNEVFHDLGLKREHVKTNQAHSRFDFRNRIVPLSNERVHSYCFKRSTLTTTVPTGKNSVK